MPRHFITHYSGYVCEDIFWMKLTFASIDCIKQQALPNAGGPHPTLNRTEGWREFFPDCLRLWSFLAFELRLKYQFFLVIEPAGFWTETYTFSSHGPSAWQLQFLGLLSLYNCRSQFLIITLFIYIYMHITCMCLSVYLPIDSYIHMCPIGSVSL